MGTNGREGGRAGFTVSHESNGCLRCMAGAGERTATRATGQKEWEEAGGVRAVGSCRVGACSSLSLQ